MLDAYPKLMFKRRHNDLLAFKMASLQFDQGRWRGVPIIGHEDNERQRFRGVRKEVFKVGNGGVHEFLTVGRMRLERAGDSFEI